MGALLLVAALLCAAAPTAPTDNSRCLVCHLNFKREELVMQHLRAGIRCVTCHGDSSAHTSDEDNVTPPDIVYPKAKVNAFCTKCHRKEHKPMRGRHPRHPYYTNCHGKHWLPGDRKWQDCGTAAQSLIGSQTGNQFRSQPGAPARLELVR